MNFLGLIIAVTTFLVIGIFHPIVIKSEYYFGVKCWWVFLISGLAFIIASLFTDNEILSPVLGVIGCSCLWSLHQQAEPDALDQGFERAFHLYSMNDLVPLCA